jgi:predicted acylesterase/phospholipase RssA
MEFDLVFEGGGAKGMVFVGAMQAFEDAGHTASRLLGTSAGAITATLLAAGYDSGEMLTALDEKDNGEPVFVGFMGTPGPFDEALVEKSSLVELFKSIDLPLVPEFVEKGIDKAMVGLLSGSEKYRHLFSFVELGGWFTAKNFLTWMERKLNEGTFNGQPRNFGGMSLKEFFGATGKELSLVASDTTSQQLLVLNHRTAPDCPVKWAVRMSMSIPLVWQEVKWRADWGAYQGKEIAGHKIVDGGILSNFPIELFFSNAAYVTAVMGEQKTGNIAGLLIDETLAVPGAPPAPAAEKKFDFGKLKTIQRLGNLIDTMTKAHDKRVMEQLEDLVVRVPAKGYGTTEFGMSDERRNALVAGGRGAMEAYLSGLSARGAKGRDFAAMSRALERASSVAAGILAAPAD